jgi:hypothetical protein
MYRGPRRVVSTGDSGAFDTVNRSGRTMTHVVGRLVAGETLTELRAALAGGAVGDALIVEATGETPPHSRMTWLVSLAPGRKVVLAGAGAAPQILAVVAVRGPAAGFHGRGRRLRADGASAAAP